MRLVPKSNNNDLLIIKYEDREITDDIADSVKRLNASGVNKRQICKHFRLNIRQVFQICHGDDYFSRFEMNEGGKHTTSIYGNSSYDEKTINQVRNLLENGYCHREIAVALKISNGIINAVIKRECPNLKIKNPSVYFRRRIVELRKQGLSIQDIAYRMNVSSFFIWKTLPLALKEEKP